mmetsp:Transcript_34768/g.112172  ORF Transcript_34768/g.112172 Transcript_34768/m.112172 type:complete len:208 (+) Transcript_34768:522-1145(+)
MPTSVAARKASRGGSQIWRPAESGIRPMRDCHASRARNRRVCTHGGSEACWWDGVAWRAGWGLRRACGDGRVGRQAGGRRRAWLSGTGLPKLELPNLELPKSELPGIAPGVEAVSSGVRGVGGGVWGSGGDREQGEGGGRSAGAAASGGPEGGKPEGKATGILEEGAPRIPQGTAPGIPEGAPAGVADRPAAAAAAAMALRPQQREQ